MNGARCAPAPQQGRCNSRTPAAHSHLELPAGLIPEDVKPVVEVLEVVDGLVHGHLTELEKKCRVHVRRAPLFPTVFIHRPRLRGIARRPAARLFAGEELAPDHLRRQAPLVELLERHELVHHVVSDRLGDVDGRLRRVEPIPPQISFRTSTAAGYGGQAKTRGSSEDTPLSASSCPRAHRAP